MRSMTKKETIIAGAGAILLATLVIYIVPRVYMLFAHADDSTPVSTITAKLDLTDKAITDLKIPLNMIKTAMRELEEVRRGILTQTLHGLATREINAEPVGENRIYVNTNSDARSFEINQEVEISRRGKTIRAIVKGTITDGERQDLLVHLNVDTAKELGFTEMEGITRVSMRRVIDEGDDHRHTLDTP